MGNTSLKKIMTKFVLLELIFTFCVGLLMLVGLNTFAFSDLLYKASYPETLLPNLAEKVSHNTLTEEDISDFFQYQLWENGELKANTIPEKQAAYVETAKETGKSQTHSPIMPYFFVYYHGEKQSVVLSYQLVGDFISPTLRKYLPKGEFLYWLFFFVIWGIGFFILIRRVVAKLQKELAKVTRGNQEIQQLNLEYEMEKSNVKEVADILASLNQMKSALAVSLQEQWRSQQQQKQLVQSVTHDIRTPITITQGSLELLAESDLQPDQLHLVSNAEVGMKRLGQYVEQLKHISGLLEETHRKETVTEEVLTEWEQLARSLVAGKKVKLLIHRKDPSSIELPTSSVAAALQNLVMNSLDAMAEKGDIMIDFVDASKQYEIIIKDTGAGFSKAALEKGAERFFSTKNISESGHSGLGLAIVKEIVESNHGELHFENIYQQQKVIGGKVRLLFWKDK